MIVCSAGVYNPQTSVPVSHLANDHPSLVRQTKSIRCIGDIMSKRVDWFKGPVCGIENCKSTWYYRDDGKTSCRRGHEQEVTIHQVSRARIQYLTMNTRVFKPSKMKTISAHEVERLASGRRLKKRSHEVLHPYTHTPRVLTFISISWPLCY